MWSRDKDGEMDAGDAITKHSKVDVRKTHPALYHMIMVTGVMSSALAVNFWTSNPTFNPYGIPKNLIGVIFFTLGASKLVFLNVIRDLRVVRVLMATSIGWLLFWGGSNLEQSFAGKASFQLPILYAALAAIQIPLLIEAPVNPMTEKR